MHITTIYFGAVHMYIYLAIKDECEHQAFKKGCLLHISIHIHSLLHHSIFFFHDKLSINLLLIQRTDVLAN